jgi:DNA-binding CsgD family transcriptional regulator
MAIATPSRAASRERWLTLVDPAAPMPTPGEQHRGVAIRAAVLAHHLRARREGPGPYVSIHEGGLLIGARAARFVGPADHELLWTWAAAATTDGRPRFEVLRLTSDRLVVAWCQPVLLGTEAVGAVIRLDGTTPVPGPDRRGSRWRGAWSSLSTVQLNVVEHVAAGVGTREAARRLHLSPHTVAGHLRVISEVLGISSPEELAACLAVRRARPPRVAPGIDQGVARARRVAGGATVEP